jgi:hypothetical protein
MLPSSAEDTDHYIDPDERFRIAPPQLFFTATET